MLGLITRASDMTKKTRVVTALMYSFASGPLTWTNISVDDELIMKMRTKMMMALMIITSENYNYTDRCSHENP